MFTRFLFAFLMMWCCSFVTAQQVGDVSEWNAIDTCWLVKQQPKTALEKVNQLYAKAKANKDQVQLLKCLMYRIGIEDNLANEMTPAGIQLLKNEIASTSDTIVQSVLYSLLANQYLQYYQANRWKIYDRKKVVDVNKQDIETWHADDFGNAISENFSKSIAHASLLQNQPLANYSAIVFKGNAAQLRPTLYDILVHEALDYFKTGDYYLTKPTYAFELKDIRALSNADLFVKTAFQSADTSSHLLKCLHLFQQLLRFHSTDADKNAFVDVDLERIQWVNRNLVVSHEIAYLQSLKWLTGVYAYRAVEAYYLLAKHHSEAAFFYHPFRDTTKRYEYIKAMHIINECLGKYNHFDSVTFNLKTLKQNIMEQSFSITAEEVNVPNKPFRVLVNYRNIDTLFIRIFKIEGYENLVNKVESNKFYYKNLLKLPEFEKFIQVLPVSNDHQRHSVEIKINALPYGKYVLLTSSDPNFSDTLRKMVNQIILVSNISYIKNGNDYFVLHRESGKPLSNIDVTITKAQWNQSISNYEMKVIAMIKTDKNGYFRFQPTGSMFILPHEFVFKCKNDYLKVNPDEYLNIYSKNSDDDVLLRVDTIKYERKMAKMYFFADRSTYYPGQTISFKAIAITQDYTTKKYKILSCLDSILVYLKDGNGNKIDSLYLKANAFGSCFGKFLIPQNVIGEQLTIQTDKFSASNINVSVIDHKLPSFFVEFDSLKRVFKVNDSITITGFVKAYSNKMLAGASVRFGIWRNARFIYDWLWRNSYTPNCFEVQVAEGTIVTDTEGKFTITFKAVVDESIKSEREPIFDFTIVATVTDFNDEKQIVSKKISVGYKQLQLHIAIPKQAEADCLTSINIITKSVNGEHENTKVKVNIYSVQTPQRLIRKRLWERPDMFIMNKNTFLKWFPNDEYEDDLNELLWPVKKLVFTGYLNTLKNNSLSIPKNLLSNGYYKIEAIANDKDGKTVKDVRYIQLYKRNATPYPQYNFNYVINNAIKPGNYPSFLSGSMATETFVICKINRPKLAGKDRSLYLFNMYPRGLHHIDYRVDESDVGNLTVNKVFVQNNRVYINDFHFNISDNEKKLNIHYSSHRNKVESNTKETWNIKISDYKGKNVAAELITSMHSTNIDQFNVHKWEMPPIGQSPFSVVPFLGHKEFSTTHMHKNYVYEYKPMSSLKYHKLLKFKVVSNQGRAYPTYNNSKNSLLGVSISKEFNEIDVPYWSSLFYDYAFISQPDGSIRIKSRGIQYANSLPLLYVIDGVIASLEAANSYDLLKKITPENIEYIEILDGENALSLYGYLAQNGAVIFTTKSGAKKQQEKPVQPRKNFNETAFFFPQLHADSLGNYSFSFTMPEALTQWKWQSLAHTKDLAFGYAATTITTQKTLMVQPNVPRFVREGDQLELVAKVVNLSDKELTGQVRLELLDASTHIPVDGWFQNVFPNQYFTVAAGQSSAVKFPIQIPFSFNKPLTWRITARAGNYSDGEENTLPVLSNRMLVTESLPILIKGDTTQHFVFDKLVNNHSETLTHQSLTVEYTPNLIWTAVQALPYLMEYPYECAEQTFNRLFANALATQILAKHPRIKTVFDQWQLDTTTVQSNLEKNAELKQILLQETPWVLQAANQKQQQKNIAVLFDVVKMSNGAENAIAKLKKMQLSNGAFPWFSGGHEDRYITNYILTGLGKLKQMGAISGNIAKKLDDIAVRALVGYADNTIKDDYERLKRKKADLQKQQITPTQIRYLYMRSFFNQPIQPAYAEAYNYFYHQAKQFWHTQNLYHQAMIGIALYQNKETSFVLQHIVPAIVQHAINDSTHASTYWKDRYTNSWYAAPIEHQTMLIQFLETVAPTAQQNLATTIQWAKNWLLLNKQAHHWSTTMATAEACYTLFNQKEVLANDKQVQIYLNHQPLKVDAQQAGSGYVKTTMEGTKVTPQMGHIVVKVAAAPSASNNISYGSVYWQYFEDMDKITASTSVNPLSVRKALLIERNSQAGKVLVPVQPNEELKIGDKVMIQLVMKVERDMDYVHLKDTRSATMEPVNVLSSYKYQDGLGYYEATKDASTNFFFSQVRKGTYVFDYPVFITHSGTFSTGVAQLQCMYAPEFTGYSNGSVIRVKGD